MKGSVNETGEIYWRRGNTMDADKHRAVEEVVLAIYVKSVKVFKDSTAAAAKCINDNDEVSIRIQGNKWNVGFQMTKDTTSALWYNYQCNQLRHLTLQVLADEPTFEVALVRRSVLTVGLEEVIAVKELTFSEVKEKNPFYGTICLSNNEEISLVEVDVGFGLSFGLYGYGNAQVVGKSEHDILEKCHLSMFPRVVDGNNMDSSGMHYMSCAVQRPHFIPFNKTTSFRIYNSNVSEGATSPRSSHQKEFSELKKAMKRLPHWCKKLDGISQRSDRIEFLKKLVSSSDKANIQDSRFLAVSPVITTSAHGRSGRAGAQVSNIL